MRQTTHSHTWQHDSAVRQHCPSCTASCSCQPHIGALYVCTVRVCICVGTRAGVPSRSKQPCALHCNCTLASNPAMKLAMLATHNPGTTQHTCIIASTKENDKPPTHLPPCCLGPPSHRPNPCRAMCAATGWQLLHGLSCTTAQQHAAVLAGAAWGERRPFRRPTRHCTALAKQNCSAVDRSKPSPDTTSISHCSARAAVQGCIRRTIQAPGGRRHTATCCGQAASQAACDTLRPKTPLGALAAALPRGRLVVLCGVLLCCCLLRTRLGLCSCDSG